VQEEEFRKPVDDDRRRAEERKWQGSMGSGKNRYATASSAAASAWGGVPTWGTTSNASTNVTHAHGFSPPSPDRSSAGSPSRSSASSSWSSTMTASGWGGSSATSSASPTKFTSARSGPPADSAEPSAFSPNVSKWEWVRRQAELAKEQQERFRREQERLERERQAKASAGARVPTKEEVIQLFSSHERMWGMVAGGG
jgi:hypothetical protein